MCKCVNGSWMCGGMCLNAVMYNSSCSVLQCAAMCGSVLQSTVVWGYVCECRNVYVGEWVGVCLNMCGCVDVWLCMCVP